MNVLPAPVVSRVADLTVLCDRKNRRYVSLLYGRHGRDGSKKNGMVWPDLAPSPPPFKLFACRVKLPSAAAVTGAAIAFAALHVPARVTSPLLAAVAAAVEVVKMEWAETSDAARVTSRAEATNDLSEMNIDCAVSLEVRVRCGRKVAGMKREVGAHERLGGGKGGEEVAKARGKGPASGGGNSTRSGQLSQGGEAGRGGAILEVG